MAGRAATRWVWGGLLALALVLFGQAESAARAAGGYKAKSFVIADRKKDQVRPRISGDWVVWKDYRDLSGREVDASPNGEIYGRQLSTDTEVKLSVSKNAAEPAVSGDVLVWTEGLERRTEIRGAYLNTDVVFRFVESDGNQQHPAVSDWAVVWQDSRNEDWDIYGYDLSTRRELAIVEAKGDQQAPAISGRTVVWEDWRDRQTGPDLYSYNLETRKTTRLTTNHDAFEPAIAGRWVVWVGRADQAVFARDLEAGKTRRLSKAAGPKSQPAIAGDLVVWTDERDGDRDIYGYDLVANTEFPVAVKRDSDQDDPSIDETTIVWSDGRGPNRDIFGARLQMPRDVEPRATATPKPTAAPTSPPRAATSAPVAMLRVVNTGGAGVNLRASPSASAARVRSEPEGTLLAVIGDPRQREGTTWYEVRDQDGATGWVIGDFVEPV